MNFARATNWEGAASSRKQGLRVCFASDYAQGMHTYNGLSFEACTTLASLASGRILAPEIDRRGSLWKVASRASEKITGLPLPRANAINFDETCDLFFYVGMTPRSLSALQSISGWRKRSGKAAAFLFETWSKRAEENKELLRLLDDFDHVFLFNANSVATIQKYTRAPCSYLPSAVDCLTATPYPDPPHRPIDIYGMGRTVDAVHDQLVDLTLKNELLYLWDPGSAHVRNYPQARQRTYHQIRCSRFFTSFNFTAAPSKSAAMKLAEAGGEEAIPARVFEGAAAGAVMIGTAPRLPEFNDLFDWPDALIDIPLDPIDMAGFYEELQAQPERIRRAGVMNAAQSLRRHDWVYRWEEILRTLDLPTSSEVDVRKQRLSDLADLAEATL